MARSKRRCAVSLHEVAKWTLPSRWSVSSWPNAGCPHEMQADAATDKAAADHMPNFDVIAELPCLRRRSVNARRPADVQRSVPAALAMRTDLRNGTNAYSGEMSASVGRPPLTDPRRADPAAT